MNALEPGNPNCLLTVVITCGPHERYREGLKSILGRQDIPPGVELLIVNDSDMALTMIPDNPRQTAIRIVDHGMSHRPGGVSAARNAGLAQARGRYVAFVDADDRPNLTEFLSLSERAASCGAQLAIGGFRRVPPSSTIRYCIESLTIQSLLVSIVSLVGVWRMIFERNFLVKHGLRFTSISYGEDLVFALDVDAERPKVLRTSQVVYEYIDDDSDERLSQRQVNQISRSELLACLSDHVHSPRFSSAHRVVAAAWAARIRRRTGR